MRRLDRDTVRAASPLADVIAELTDQQPTAGPSGEVKFRCPFHEDGSPSLRVHAEKATWYCDPCQAGGDVFTMVQRMRGCDFPAAMTFLATRAGLHNSATATATTGTIVATHDYTDEAGTLLYQVCRMEPKDFRQRRPDGHGGWIWKLDKVRRVLFGLPALHGQKVVYVAEGEKDVLALRALHLPATTNAGGAGKWLADYTTQLKALGVESVVVLPDNDLAGRSHAATVAKSCTAAGLNVKVVELRDLPTKGDVSDWLAAGHSRDELAALVKGTPLYVLPAAVNNSESTAVEGKHGVVVRLADVTAVPITWLWPSRIARGKLTLIVGDPGLGKSWVTLDIAARVSSGAGWPDGGGVPIGDVVLLSAEDALDDTIRPRLDALRADVTRIHALTAIRDEEQRMPVLTRDLDVLEDVITATRAKLVIIDPLSAYLGDTDSHRDSDVRAVLAPVAAIAQRTGAAVVGVMHLSKGTQRPALYRAIGSIAFAAAARLVLAVAPHPDDDTRRLLAPIKSNICIPAETLGYRLEEGSRLVWDAEPVRGIDTSALLGGENREAQEDRSAADDVIAELLEEESWPLDAKRALEAAKAHGIPERTMRLAAKRARIEIRRVGYGPHGRWVWHRPTIEATVKGAEPHDSAVAPLTSMEDCSEIPTKTDAPELKGATPDLLAPLSATSTEKGAFNADDGLTF